MMDGMDFVDDVDTEEVLLRGYVQFVHDVHSVHCRGGSIGSNCRI